MYIPTYDKASTPKIIIFSGAGLSAESGISTFRDSNGLWENHKIEDICNEFTWKKNFNDVHRFYNDRREQLKKVEPNEAHKTIKRLYDTYKDDIFIITQNVDDLLERSGIPQDNVLHLHGFLTEMKCEACGDKWDIGYTRFNTFNQKCPDCSSTKGVRPNIVFFNGRAPMYSYLHRALEYMQHPNSLLVIVGTMGNVVLIDELTRRIPKQQKILNNLEKSAYINENNYESIFYEPATSALPKIEQIIYNRVK